MYSFSPKPIHLETLSSYILRTALGNGTNPITIWNRFKTNPKYYPQRSDFTNIDLYPPNTLDVNRFSKVFRIDLKSLYDMTFYNVFMKFGEAEQLHTARFMKGMMRTILHFCPLCMKEKSFFNLKWRIHDLDICEIHMCKLLSACSSCKQNITWLDVLDFEHCPYCTTKFPRAPIGNITTSDEQTWFHRAWDFLISPTNIALSGTELAMRLIYLLNECREVFDRTTVQRNFSLMGCIQNLLQYARGTWRQPRTIHISMMLKILYQLCFPIDQLFNMKLPDGFEESVKTPGSNVHNPLGRYCNNKYTTGFEDELIRTCEKMIDFEEPITVKHISKLLDVSPNTLRTWGAVSYITEMKSKQRQILKQKKINKLIEKIDIFFSNELANKVYAKCIFEYLGIRQSYLCGYSPSLLAHIALKRKAFNGK